VFLISFTWFYLNLALLLFQLLKFVPCCFSGLMSIFYLLSRFCGSFCNSCKLCFYLTNFSRPLHRKVFYRRVEHWQPDVVLHYFCHVLTHLQQIDIFITSLNVMSSLFGWHTRADWWWSIAGGLAHSIGTVCIQVRSIKDVGLGRDIQVVLFCHFF
jgi:hypothetical protein